MFFYLCIFFLFFSASNTISKGNCICESVISMPSVKQCLFVICKSVSSYMEDKRNILSHIIFEVCDLM